MRLHFSDLNGRMCAMARKKNLSWYLKRAACWALLVIFSPVIAVCYVGAFLANNIIDEDLEEMGGDGHGED